MSVIEKTVPYIFTACAWISAKMINGTVAELFQTNLPQNSPSYKSHPQAVEMYAWKLTCSVEKSAACGPTVTHCTSLCVQIYSPIIKKIYKKSWQAPSDATL